MSRSGKVFALSDGPRPPGVAVERLQRSEAQHRQLFVDAERRAADLVRTEAALRESDERQKFLLGLGDAIRPIADPDEIKKSAATLLGDYLAVNRAFYASAQAANDFWLVAEGFERDIAPLPRQPFAMSAYGNWIVEAFKSGRSLVVDDMALDPRFDASERDAHLTLQIRSQIAAPLFKDDRLVAMLVVQSAAPRGWSAARLR